MPTLHSTITGADNHEPKGVESAAATRVYKANGSGSGSWGQIAASEVTVQDTANVLTGTNVETVLYELYQTENLIEGQFAASGTAETVLLPVPFSAQVVSITFILNGTIATANPTVTITRSDGAAMGSQTLTASGSAEGTTFVFTPSGNATLTSPTHKYVKLVLAPNSSTSPQKVYIQARIKKV